jgi:hypothetical protein
MVAAAIKQYPSILPTLVLRSLGFIDFANSPRELVEMSSAAAKEQVKRLLTAVSEPPSSLQMSE